MKEINSGITSFTDSEYQNLILEYDCLIDEWEKELRQGTDNYLFGDELCLWTRMKYDNKKMNEKIRGDRDEILYFLKDFKIISTNNPAEITQRSEKIKQKIGKFRCDKGANTYAIIRSCISTYKKTDINVFVSLISVFNNQVVIV